MKQSMVCIVQSRVDVTEHASGRSSWTRRFVWQANIGVKDLLCGIDSLLRILQNNLWLLSF